MGIEKHSTCQSSSAHRAAAQEGKIIPAPFFHSMTICRTEKRTTQTFFPLKFKRVVLKRELLDFLKSKSFLMSIESYCQNMHSSNSIDNKASIVMAMALLTKSKSQPKIFPFPTKPQWSVNK